MLARSIVATKIEISKKQKLMIIEWEHGTTSKIPFTELRNHCACAFCRSKGQLGKQQNLENISVDKVVPMGSSGLQIIFSDGHDRGIFPWGYLEAIGKGRGLDHFNELE